MTERRLRALVTRPREDSEKLTAALRSRAIEAVIEPLIEIRYCAAEALDLCGLQAVLCTSANGVRALARVSAERQVPLLAVGDATAARARREGFSTVESAAGDVTSLAALAAVRLRPENGPLLHVAGNVVAGDLAGALRAEGFTVERRMLYEARPAAALSPAVIDAFRARSINFALFFSPRTGVIFVRLAAMAGISEHCRTMTALSISPAADAVLADLSWLDRRVAGRSTQAGMLEVLDHVLGR